MRVPVHRPHSPQVQAPLPTGKEVAAAHPLQQVVAQSPATQRLTQLSAIANGQPAVVQRTVAIASDKMEGEVGVAANAATRFDGALLAAGFEASKITGGPVKLLSQLQDADVQDEEQISIVGHGTASQATGGITIPNVVAALTGKQFGEDQANHRRKGHVYLFSCISASEVEDTPGSDAALYKQEFARNGTDVNIVAPKGIAIPGMHKDADKTRYTSVRLEDTAVRRALSIYKKIKEYHAAVVSVAAMGANNKTFSQQANDLTHAGGAMDDAAFNPKKDLVQDIGKRQLAADAVFGAKLGTMGVDAAAAGGLPATLKDFLSNNPANAMETEVRKYIVDTYVADKLKYRTSEQSVLPVLFEDDSADDLVADIDAVNAGFVPGAGTIDNQSGAALPPAIQAVVAKFGNVANWKYI